MHDFEGPTALEIFSASRHNGAMNGLSRIAIVLVIVAAIADIAWVAHAFATEPTVTRATIDDDQRAKLDAAPTSAFIVPRADFDGAKLGFAREARVVPAFKNEAFFGLKTFSLRQDGAYQHMGLKNGDVIVRIDGRLVAPPESDLERALRTQSKLTIDLFRRNEPMRLDVTIDPSAPPTPKSDAGVDSLAPGEPVVVKKTEIDELVKDTNQLATQARVVPAFEEGTTIGVKLFSMRPGSFFQRLGFQNGDIITEVNGLPITSMERSLEAYEKLKDAKELLVDIKRRGVEERLVIRIE
jgi:general secretion pathway protein C